MWKTIQLSLPSQACLSTIRSIAPCTAMRAALLQAFLARSSAAVARVSGRCAVARW